MSCSRSSSGGSPIINLYTDRNPYIQRKYHDTLDTYDDSRSGSAISKPRWNMDLNPTVNGNGTLSRMNPSLM